MQGQSTLGVHHRRARRHLYGSDPYYDDAYYYDGRYYRRRRGFARDDGTMLLGGLLLADLFLF